MPKKNEVESRIKLYPHHEVTRLMRDWLGLEIERLNKSLADPKYGEIETASLRGEHKQVRKFLNLLENQNEST